MMKNRQIFLHDLVQFNVVIFINMTKTININNNKLLTGTESFIGDFILGNKNCFCERLGILLDQREPDCIFLKLIIY